MFFDPLADRGSFALDGNHIRFFNPAIAKSFQRIGAFNFADIQDPTWFQVSDNSKFLLNVLYTFPVQSGEMRDVPDRHGTT